MLVLHRHQNQACGGPEQIFKVDITCSAHDIILERKKPQSWIQNMTIPMWVTTKGRLFCGSPELGAQVLCACATRNTALWPDGEHTPWAPHFSHFFSFLWLLSLPQRLWGTQELLSCNKTHRDPFTCLWRKSAWKRGTNGSFSPCTMRVGHWIRGSRCRQMLPERQEQRKSPQHSLSAGKKQNSAEVYC